MIPGRRQHRRGGVYLAVLGAAIVVSIIGLSAMTVVRLELAASEAAADSLKSRFHAESALEIGMLEVATNSSWRLTNPNGVWRSNQTIADGQYTLEGKDPNDGSLTDNFRDPVVLRATAKRGQSRHITEVTLVDAGTPVSALAAALAVVGDVQVSGGTTLTVSGAPVSSNGTLRNSATIAGDAKALLILNTGTITGSSSILSTGMGMPAADVWQVYAKMGTALSPGSTLENCVLSPKVTPFGVSNADGIYRVDAPGGLTIRNLRIDGTLVVNCPGATVRVEGRVHMQNYRRDCPALIVNGNLELRFDGVGSLSESSVSVNLNPDGAPYLGTTDSDQLDQYPSEIRGLVHATGTLAMEQTSRVKGCVIAQSPALLNAATISGTCEIVYDPKILEQPPIGYSSIPIMRPREGSWTRVTLP